jgi:hypothetical protein
MKYAFGLAAAGALILTAQVPRPVAQIDSEPVAREEAKDLLKLSEQQKAAVINAVLEAKSQQATPKDFTPALGSVVPQSVYVHGFKPEVAGELPTLKHYWYAHLNREIVLIDGLQKKVVAVIPLPANLVSDGQQHQGAAEPADKSKGTADKSKGKDGATSAGSVPSHTSPETIK